MIIYCSQYFSCTTSTFLNTFYNWVSICCPKNPFSHLLLLPEQGAALGFFRINLEICYFIAIIFGCLFTIINIHSGLDFNQFHETLYNFISNTKEFPDFMTVKLSKFFWQISKYFLDFITNKNFSCTWDLFRKRNKNVNKYFVKI